MKKNFLSVAVILTLAASMMCTSCIGSFSLTHKLLAWNRTIDSKLVNELVFFALWVLPVYEISSLADVLVLNSIEFWSGENPVASNSKIIDGKDGRYLVESDSKGYTITNERDGAQVRLDFDGDTKTWNAVTSTGTYPLMTFVDDTHVSMPTPAGTTTVVELSQAGVLAYQDIVSGSMMAAR